MGTFLLSQRGIRDSAAHAAVYELEEILVETCGAKLLTPRAHPLTLGLHRRGLLTPRTSKLVTRTNRYYETLDVEIPKDGSPNVLLLPCMVGSEIGVLSSIPDWRSRFDVVAAYVVDAWFPYPPEVAEIDHLFVPVMDVVGELGERFGIPVSLLPLGSDVVRHGSDQPERPLDVMSFGRTPVELHRELGRAMNQPHSRQAYYRHQHPGPAKNHFPDHPRYEERVDYELRMQFHRMMTLSKIVLAFDSMYETDQIYASGQVNARPWRFRHSIIAFRWFEGCAAGCAILGKRPTTPLFDQVLDWEDSAIELPEDRKDWTPFTLALLEDEARLAAIRERNYRESLTRNDWRARILAMHEALGLEPPEGLLEAVASCRGDDPPRSA
ncbi:MAG: glycosyltransferase [Myxococcota bacterium]|nr:glycosyltransferase [Myxococcota bacterium]